MSWDWVTLKQMGIFSALDIEFATFMAQLSQPNQLPDGLLAGTAALLSALRHQGHSCLDMAQLAGQYIPLEALEGYPVLRCPPLGKWVLALRAHTTVVGAAGEYKPLIMEDNRLYLQRYWDYETRLLRWLKQRAPLLSDIADEEKLRGGLQRLFPAHKTLDWQKIAALAALLKPFCVISGGPGTGKTTTVAKILVLLLEQPSRFPLRIMLAAPTGKAAARLQESITAAKSRLPCSEAIRCLIPQESYTLHRLLGVIPYSPYFRHRADNPLPVDVVIVDEASMIDLPLLTKLVEAMPEQARLILLGDKDQLPSVEVGVVLGDICQQEALASYSVDFIQRLRQFSEEIPSATLNTGVTLIQDNIVLLQKSYRFRGDSGIGQLAQHIRQGDSEGALWLMRQTHYTDMDWRELTEPVLSIEHLRADILAGYGRYLHGEVEPLAILQRFNEFRVLAVHRRGPHGIYHLNRLIEAILMQAGLIERDPKNRWYHGQPIMITRNDYGLKLYNGDVGIILKVPVPVDGTERLMAWFQTDHPAQPVRAVPLLRLPEYQTVYAMTVHKSQGSEFQSVVLVLPEQPSPLLNKELIYTGITRARKKITLFGHRAVFQQALRQSLWRMSGIAAKLAQV